MIPTTPLMIVAALALLVALRVGAAARAALGRFALAAPLLVAGLAAAALASSSSSLFVGGPQRLPVVVTFPDVAMVTTASRLAIDDTSHGLGGKRGAVYHLAVAGNDVHVLVRIQAVGHGLFVDVVATESLPELEAAAAALDLAGLAPGHPAPAADACDEAVLTEAGG
ncbi:MAG: hypothetical protein M9894_16140 [Planctomycetes bacterium]|nr:hypothetical protein [Planctomycetota bacterium]